MENTTNDVADAVADQIRDELKDALTDALALFPPVYRPVERRYIASTLRHVHGNQTDAARLLGISRKALWEKRKRYGLE